MINHRLGLPAGRLAASKWMLFIHHSGIFILFHYFFLLFPFFLFFTRALIYRTSTSLLCFEALVIHGEPILFEKNRKKKDRAYLKGTTSGQY